MVRSGIGTFFIIFLCAAVNAQVKETIESLNKRSATLRKVQPDSSFALGRRALDLSKSLGLRKEEFLSLTGLCITCYDNQWFEQSIFYCDMAIGSAAVSKHEKELPYLFHGLSNVHLAHYNAAISSFLNYVDIAREENDEDMLADGLSNIGLAYLNDGNFLKAAEYYRASLRIHLKINSPGRHAYACQNYARIMMSLSKFDSAEFYFDEALRLGDEAQNENVKYWVYAYRESLPGYSIQHRIELREKAVEVAYKLHLSHEIAASNFGLAELLIKSNEVDRAVPYCEEAIKYGRMMEDYGLVLKTYNLLTRAMIGAGRFEQSTKYLARYEFLKDSLSEGSIKSFESIMGANELITQEREIEQVQDKLVATQAINSQNRIVLTGVVALTLLTGVILAMSIRANRTKARTNRKLQLLNEKLDIVIKEKDVLAGMMVHDIRSPFNKIEMLIDVYEMDHQISEGQRKFLDKMRTVIEDSRVLTSDLLEINRIEAGVFEKKMEQIEIKKFLCELIDEFQNSAGKKGIALKKTLALNGEIIMTDKYTLQRIIENLLSNAIKYAPLQGHVECKATLQANQFEFSVKDNGPGISESEQKLLFKKFGRTSAMPSGNETSTGLGLYIVDIMSRSLNGQILVRSAEGEGAEFQVRIPIELFFEF